jgi:hypothetical protein
VEAYFKEHDATVTVPDDFTEDEFRDVNENWNTYFQSDLEKEQAELDAKEEQFGAIRQAHPNFYQRNVEPVLQELGLVEFAPVSGRTSTAGAFLPAALESFTAGIVNFDERQKYRLKGATDDKVYSLEGADEEFVSMTGPDNVKLKVPQAEFANLYRRDKYAEGMFQENFEDHPVATVAGKVVGGFGSLVATSAVLHVTKLPAAFRATAAASAHVARVGPRFVYPALMNSATFGTNTFIKKVAESAWKQEVDIVDIGVSTLRDAGIGLGLGAIGQFKKAMVSVPSAAGLGFLVAKSEGASNEDAALLGAVWGTFEFALGFGRTARQREQALMIMRDAMKRNILANNVFPNQKVAFEVAGRASDWLLRRNLREWVSLRAKETSLNLSRS